MIINESYEEKSDLTITDVEIPDIMMLNQTYIINVTVKNIGTKEASNVSLILNDSNNVVLKTVIDTIQPNEIKIMSFNYTPTKEGNLTIMVIIDEENSIDELNELNNVLIKQVVVVISKPNQNPIITLIPRVLDLYVNETFVVDIEILNIPEDKKCGGVDISLNYNKSLISLINITPTNVSNSASLKDINIENGVITLIWFSNPPTGDFTLAKLIFKTITQKQLHYKKKITK